MTMTPDHAQWFAQTFSSLVGNIGQAVLGKPRTIAELTKERLRRAGHKVRAEKPEAQIDIGFRVYKLASSNLKVWQPGMDLEADLLDAGLIDSLALVTLIVAFEDTFGVQLPLDNFDIDRFRSVASIADFLASLGAEPMQG